MPQMRWPDERLNEIIANVPATVECTSDEAARRLRFALYRKLGERRREYSIYVSGATLRLEQNSDPILSITKESNRA